MRVKQRWQARQTQSDMHFRVILHSNDSDFCILQADEPGACCRPKPPTSPPPALQPPEAQLAATREAKPPPARAKGKARRTTVDMGRSSVSPRPAAKAAEGGIVKLGRREAWARFLAYEVSPCCAAGQLLCDVRVQSCSCLGVCTGLQCNNSTTTTTIIILPVTRPSCADLRVRRLS